MNAGHPASITDRARELFGFLKRLEGPRVIGQRNKAHCSTRSERRLFALCGGDSAHFTVLVMHAKGGGILR